jgi:para-nitrobenzyl esterase
MSDAGTVRTSGGRVCGSLVADGVRAFRGIPYAAPPFGAARLRAPQPAPGWDGVLAATAFGPIPPQPVRFAPGPAAWSPADGTDILTVNVWAPADGSRGLPVLVWIYGGAYTSGSANPYYPAALVRAGLVVVTLNYRVGFEGFGHVPGAPDNRGLLDQAAALRWVRGNVAGFGGDPDLITIAGESAGAGSVVSLSVMPSAAGLFRRAIAHSVPSEFMSPAAAAAIGARIAAEAGVPAEAADLARVAPGGLIEAASRVLAQFRGNPASGVRYYVPTIFNPVVDGEVLPDAPLPAVAAGRATATDLLLCHTLDEFRLFSVTGRAPAVQTEDDLAAVAAAFGQAGHRLDRYRALGPPEAVPDVYARIVTDFLFGEYTTRLAEAAARAGGRAHLARFAWRSPALGGALGACHGADVPFCFGDLTRQGGIAGLALPEVPTEEDQALSDRIVAAWAGFAATGDPGWPAITADAAPVRIWDRTDRLDAETGGGTRPAWADFAYQPVELAG